MPAAQNSNAKATGAIEAYTHLVEKTGGGEPLPVVAAFPPKALKSLYGPLAKTIPGYSNTSSTE